MARQSFGGPWTQDKLERLKEYLTQYRVIFSANPRAQYFRTWYVDAFAGTGRRATGAGKGHTEPGLFDDVYDDSDNVAYLDGSVRIALNLPSPFDRYFFIEKSTQKEAELRQTLEQEFPERFERCEIVCDDANAALRKWCAARDWRKERAVVFLDPYGMQVEWSTIEVLASTKGVDLWYLFPLGIGVSRLLTRDGRIDPSWESRLNTVLGTNAWRERFYSDPATIPLFPENPAGSQRVADTTGIKDFIIERLEECFDKVATGLILYNSRQSPLYLLCFASANAAGLKIANYILGAPARRR